MKKEIHVGPSIYDKFETMVPKRGFWSEESEKYFESLPPREKGVGLKYDNGKPSLGLLPIEVWRMQKGLSPLTLKVIEALYKRDYKTALQWVDASWYQVAFVLDHGALKYEAESWRKVRPMARYFHAALRHLVVEDEHGFFYSREPGAIDPDSGLPHAAHAKCCIAFLLGLQSDGVQLFEMEDSI